jgi:hypothetical protein
MNSLFYVEETVSIWVSTLAVGVSRLWKGPHKTWHLRPPVSAGQLSGMDQTLLRRSLFQHILFRRSSLSLSTSMERAITRDYVHVPI